MIRAFRGAIGMEPTKRSLKKPQRRMPFCSPPGGGRATRTKRQMSRDMKVVHKEVRCEGSFF